jgi:adenylate kinase family enzyme
MRRVLVIGSGGAGKSTFARRLACRTGLPLIHLDAIYWKPGWQETPKQEWARIVENLVAGDRWVMDGNYGGTLEQRLAACDTAVFLDIPRSVCLWRATVRRVRYRGRPRPDMKEGCPEQLTWDFVRWIWTYPVERRPKILQRLSTLDAGRRVVVLRSATEIEDFFHGLSCQRA